MLFTNTGQQHEAKTEKTSNKINKINIDVNKRHTQATIPAEEKKSANDSVTRRMDKHLRSNISQLHRRLLGSINKNMQQHSALKIESVTAEQLLMAWERFIIVSNWSRSTCSFSTADLILLSLIFATIAHVLPPPTTLRSLFTPSPQPAPLNAPVLPDAATEREAEFFKDGYHIAEVMKELRPIEVFYVSVLVTKMVLDIEERAFHGTCFNRFELQILMDQLSEDAVLSKVRPTLRTHRFKQFRHAAFILQLYVSDVSLPLGKISVELPPFANVDKKIEEYMSKILKRATVPADFMLDTIENMIHTPHFDSRISKGSDEPEQDLSGRP